MSGLLAVFNLRTLPFDRLVLANVDVRGPSGLLLPPSGDPGIPSKQIPVKILIIQITSAPFSPGPVWLAPSLCPFNFSGLESLGLSGPLEARITNLLHSIQPTLHKLNIDASMIVYAHSDLSALQLADYTGLKELTVTSSGVRGTTHVIDLLKAIGTGTHRKLENVHIEITVFETSTMQGDPLDEEPLPRLDVLLAGLNVPALRSVWVRILRIHARGIRDPAKDEQRIQQMRRTKAISQAPWARMSQIDLRDPRRPGRWDRALTYRRDDTEVDLAPYSALSVAIYKFRRFSGSI
ncbi:hypothetical protein B0H16DRAFT_1454002 [Mycena metata]|uniref:Uncharacterized protein n=1 Tax=Mycena metata TaxID=1033252 RepID=A0AAD7JMM9_9AGAR|nr:hypothetical protein B0H16DRAFT_1454002 [Mycena metata]